MNMIIDPPGLTAPLEQWYAFRAELEQDLRGDQFNELQKQDLRQALRHAHETIAWQEDLERELAARPAGG